MSTEAPFKGKLILKQGRSRSVKRLHVSLKDEIHMAAKVFSTYMNITINEVMSKAIIHYLRSQTDYKINDHLKEEIHRLTSDE